MKNLILSFFVIGFALCSCSNPSNEEILIGEWNITSHTRNGEELLNTHPSLTNMKWKFGGDGVFIATSEADTVSGDWCHTEHGYYKDMIQLPTEIHLLTKMVYMRIALLDENTLVLSGMDTFEPFQSCCKIHAARH